MQLIFACPRCERTVRQDCASSECVLRCDNCEWTRDVSGDGVENDAPVDCLVCNCSDLWRQKDFPPRLGLLIVGLGAGLSTIAWYHFWIKSALAILMVFAAIDLLLFVVMRDVLVCYRCGARHRHVNLNEDHPRFNLEMAERYRQETQRLEGTAKSKTR